MAHSLAYERVRITTVRSTWISLALAVLLPMGLAALAASPNPIYDEQGNQIGETVDWIGGLGAPLMITAVIASVVASQAIGQEYRFGIIRLTLTAFPRRIDVLLSKILVVTAASVVLALVSFASAWAILALRGYPAPPPDVVAPDAGFYVRGILSVVLWALSAFALAGITRQTAIGIAVPIISGFIVEQIVGALVGGRAAWVADILPWSALGRWGQSPQPVDPGFEEAFHQPPVGWGGIGVFVVWLALFLALQVWAFLRRDA
jgi:ABC-2 type transport system permease protein